MSECASPCATCPWRKENFGKPNPPGYDAQMKTDASDTHDYHDWYSKKNALRLWNGIREGNAMICHATDPNAPNYGGKVCTPGHERPCTGMVVLVLKHIQLLEKCRTWKAYREQAGPRPLTKLGLAMWAERILLNNISNRLPKSVNGDGVQFPFESPLNQ